MYLAAFASLAVQVVGLVGEHGLLPAATYLERARAALGAAAYHELPTLFWIDASDAALALGCWSGAALSLLLVAGVAPLPILVLLWALYLSAVVVGQSFLGFQWDALLLETGLLAIFWAPATPCELRRAAEPSTAVRWVLWLLVFKLMFLSGVTKLASGDATWADLTALEYHYWTQPLPTWTSWYAAQLPGWFQRASVALVLCIEIGAPFASFAPPRWRALRWAGCALLVLLQVAIAATGNYGFFNLLAVVLCLTLLDDAVLRRCLPARLVAAVERARRPRTRVARGVAAGVAAILVPLSLLSLDREVARTGGGAPALGDAVLGWIAPLRSVNGYGLFRVMTTERLELGIEGSQDGRDWTPYAFRWKPGDPARRPRFTGPHMPRLDWQMWFAALNPRGQQGWLVPLLRHMLEGTPEVLALLGPDPFSGTPPRYVRLRVDRYRFAPPDSADWWVREPAGILAGPLTLDDLGR